VSPTGPPRQRRPDERPRELLDAALRVFAVRGYRATRLDDVAAAAGATKGAIYHYFADKEELLVRALEQHQARALGRLDDALSLGVQLLSGRRHFLCRESCGCLAGQKR